jgi:glucose-6-phosphate 1-dehydrogenase
LKLGIENWRWAGIPIYLRTGKRLPYRTTETDLAFNRVPTARFDGLGTSMLHPNHLTICIQPHELIQFEFLAKVPGPEMDVKQVAMDFSYPESFEMHAPEAYERVLHDAMDGDQTLFVREDGIERAWEIVDPVLKDPPPVSLYRAGTWGPPEADELIAPNVWHMHASAASEAHSPETSIA